MAQIYSGFYIQSHSRSLPKRPCVLRHALCGHMIQQQTSWKILIQDERNK